MKEKVLHPIPIHQLEVPSGRGTENQERQFIRKLDDKAELNMLETNSEYIILKGSCF